MRDETPRSGETTNSSYFRSKKEKRCRNNSDKKNAKKTSHDKKTRITRVTPKEFTRSSLPKLHCYSLAVKSRIWTLFAVTSNLQTLKIACRRLCCSSCVDLQAHLSCLQDTTCLSLCLRCFISSLLLLLNAYKFLSVSLSVWRYSHFLKLTTQDWCREKKCRTVHDTLELFLCFFFFSLEENV